MSDLSLMTDRTVLALYGSHAVADGLHHTSTVECETELLRRLSRPSLADALIAAGYRKLQDDAVVVGRDDLHMAVDDIDYSQPQDYEPQFFEAMERLRAALEHADE